MTEPFLDDVRVPPDGYAAASHARTLRPCRLGETAPGNHPDRLTPCRVKLSGSRSGPLRSRYSPSEPRVISPGLASHGMLWCSTKLEMVIPASINDWTISPSPWCQINSR